MIKSFKSNSEMSMSSFVFSISFARRSTKLSKMIEDSSLNYLSLSSSAATACLVMLVGRSLYKLPKTFIRFSNSAICSSLISLKI